MSWAFSAVAPLGIPKKGWTQEIDSSTFQIYSGNNETSCPTHFVVLKQLIFSFFNLFIILQKHDFYQYRTFCKKSSASLLYFLLFLHTKV